MALNSDKSEIFWSLNPDKSVVVGAQKIFDVIRSYDLKAGLGVCFRVRKNP